MKVVGTEKDIEKICPACKVPAGVYCGFNSTLGGLVHERRVTK